MKKIPIILLIISMLILASCASNSLARADSENRTTDTKSSGFSSKAEKIEFLEKYLITPTEIIDAEYHIIYFDNSTGLIPGPSDWNVKVAIKIEPDKIDEWIKHMETCPSEQIDMTWWDELPFDRFDWKSVSAELEYYKEPNYRSFLVVYREDGILLKYVYTW